MNEAPQDTHQTDDADADQIAKLAAPYREEAAAIYQKHMRSLSDEGVTARAGVMVQTTTALTFLACLAYDLMKRGMPQEQVQQLLSQLPEDALREAREMQADDDAGHA